MGCLPRESYLEHGCDQCGGYAMPGDVGNQDADTLFVDHQKIVKVSGDSAHGQIAGDDFQAGELRDFAGQNGRLNLVGDLQFFVDS